MNHIICSVFGDCNVICREDTFSRIKITAEKLIKEQGVDIFLFCGHSEFESLCLEAVTHIKTDYPGIRRLFVRSEYEYVNNEYKEFITKHYDDTFCPFDSNRTKNTRYMIENSKYCVFYFGQASRSKSTTTAYRYAKKQKKSIVNLFL